MKLFFVLVFLIVFPAVLKAQATEPDQLAPVVLSDFVGTWFEISTIPQFFQRGCSATKATYTALPNGDIDVFNECKKNGLDGQVSSIHGKAWTTDTTNAKLRVQFFWPFSAPYWIFDLDVSRGIAVIGSPDRTYLWILSRYPHISDNDYQAALETAVRNGFDISHLVKTLQP